MGHYQTLRTHAEEGVLVITLNRPERRNALSPEMIHELTEALEAAGESHHGAIILTGAGSAFCAGLDLDHLETMTARTRDQHRADSENIARVLRTLHNVPKPTIAAVNGAALAGGMGLATICDFTLSVPEAKFGYTEVKIGFIPAIVSSFLIRQIGDKLRIAATEPAWNVYQTAAQVLCDEITSVDAACGERAAEALLRPVKTARRVRPPPPAGRPPPRRSACPTT